MAKWKRKQGKEKIQTKKEWEKEQNSINQIMKYKIRKKVFPKNIKATISLRNELFLRK